MRASAQNVGLRALALDLDRAAAALARAEGRRDALRDRHDHLERDISLAKGRLEIRDEVEAFVEEVQAETSRRNLASFETLLTALVREVLPGEKPVSLELSTERGLASLDIGVTRADGTREDVLEDNGGALTNVIGMALRLIAVVKAGAGRFLALDEGDCWIAPDRIPAFFHVLEDGAARLGIQCLAISHHDVASFNGRLRVCRVVGEPVGGVEISGPDPEGWRDDMPGFRHIRLLDVQGFADATLRLGPGVNALVGPNNRGKSTFVRALRAVFYGEGRDSLVRAGKRTATVELGLARGRVLRFTRRPGRSPVNLWSLHEADGAVAVEAGTRLETGGRSVPDWVERLFGIVRVEGLDVHIAHQKFPVFLLGEPPSKRSAVLSVGQEAAYVRDMLAIHRERSARDAAFVKGGERELATIRDSLKALDDLPDLAREVAGLRARAADIEVLRQRADALKAGAANLARAQRDLARARVGLEALEALPETAALQEIAARLDASRAREGIGARLFQAARSLEVARRRAAILADLPPALPAVEDLRSLRAAANGMAETRASIAAARGRVARVAEDLERVRREAAGIVEEMEGLCPTCGSPVDPSRFLEGHLHVPLAGEAA